jgi:hypothetical protein
VAQGLLAKAEAELLERHELDPSSRDQMRKAAESLERRAADREKLNSLALAGFASSWVITSSGTPGSRPGIARSVTRARCARRDITASSGTSKIMGKGERRADEQDRRGAHPVSRRPQSRLGHGARPATAAASW